MRKKLKEVCDFYSGTGFPVKYQGEDNGELPFYKVGDIANNATAGNIYLSLCNNFISYGIAKEIRGTIIPADVVVFAKIGEALKLNRRAITSCDCLIDNNAMGIGGKSEYLNSMYFYFFMKNLKMETLAESTTVPSVRKTKLEEIEMEVPALEEQSKIVNIVAILQKVINERQEQLAKLNELIKARFVELYGDPIHSDKYGTRKLLSCVADKTDMVDGPFGSQVNTKVDYIENGEIPVIRTVNVKMMSFSSVDLKYMTREKYETVIRSQVLPGDVILTKVGTIGNVCIFPDTFDEAVLSTTGSCRIRVDSSIMNTEFFAYNLMYLKEKLLEIASAGVQPFLNMNHVKNIDILDVPLGKQIEFADFVKQVDKSKLLHFDNVA